MITITKEMEAIVKDIGAIKSARGLEEYFQSLSFEMQNNVLIKNLVYKRKKQMQNAI